jgi:hypothetical protein
MINVEIILRGKKQNFLSLCAQEPQFSGPRGDASGEEHTVTIYDLTRMSLSPTLIRLVQQVSLSTRLLISSLSSRL